MNVPKMPEEFKGVTNKNGGYTDSAPRKWTKQEIEFVEMLMSKGYSTKDIAESTDRTLTSVAIKIKRLSKKNNTYNENHVAEKYECNSKFIAEIQPDSVLDLYTGEKNFYNDVVEKVITNDIDARIPATYHDDALKCICRLYSEGKQFDVVDLDPFGSAYDCFDLAVKMAKKGLIITFGEMGHKRWKRLDYVGRYYGIDTLDAFTIDNIIEHVRMIGRRNKKELTPVIVKEWRNVSRVWFKIENIKITEQWKGKTNVCIL